MRCVSRSSRSSLVARSRAGRGRRADTARTARGRSRSNCKARPRPPGRASRASSCRAASTTRSPPSADDARASSAASTRRRSSRPTALPSAQARADRSTCPTRENIPDHGSAAAWSSTPAGLVLTPYHLDRRGDEDLRPPARRRRVATPTSTPPTPAATSRCSSCSTPPAGAEADQVRRRPHRPIGPTDEADRRSRVSSWSLMANPYAVRLPDWTARARRSGASRNVRRRLPPPAPTRQPRRQAPATTSTARSRDRRRG